MTVMADIGEQAIAGLDHACFPRHMPDAADKTGNFRFAGPRRKIVPTDIFALRNYQNMMWRLWVDVMKSEDMVIFIHGLIGDFPAQNFGEDILVIIRLGCINRQGSVLS